MTIAFVGHRKIETTSSLKDSLQKIIEEYIINKGASVFLFGSKSEFNDLCYDIVTELKNRYKTIRRIYIRAEYEYINSEYEEYILTMYEETYFPDGAHARAFCRI